MHGIIKKMAVLSIIFCGVILSAANACQNKPAEYLADDLLTKGSQLAIKSYPPTAGTKSQNNKHQIESVDESSTSNSQQPKSKGSVPIPCQLKTHV